MCIRVDACFADQSRLSISLTMTYLLLIAILANGSSDIAAAQKLYDEAKYQAAHDALGKTCEAALDDVGCEELRASILMALGERDLAVAAYTRALLSQPDFEVSMELSPRLLELFKEAKELARGVSRVKLESVTSDPEDRQWHLTTTPMVSAPFVEGGEIETVTLYFSAPGSDVFSAAPLALEGDHWSGRLSIGPTHISGIGWYYLRIGMSKGAQLRVGSFEQPRPVRVRRTFESSQFSAVTEGWSGDRRPDSSPNGGQVAMPEWVGMATAVGLATLAVGTVVALVIIWDNRPRSNPNQDTAPTAQPAMSTGLPLISW